MSSSGLSVGIVGLPNAGKSTLFNALLKRQIAQVAEYPYTTIEPNVGVVGVPDKRLVRLREIVAARPWRAHERNDDDKQTKDLQLQFPPSSLVVKIVPAAIKFIDIAGLVKDAHKGAGLGNQFLAKIREVDTILHVVRAFENPAVAHVLGEIDPQRDIKVVNQELKLAGIDKPAFIYLNRKLPDESVLTNIIRECYQLLDLVTVFTIEGGRQIQSWPIKRGLTVLDVAGTIHSDFAKKFIRAEVIAFEQLNKVSYYQEAKIKGWVGVEGKDYQVQEGDIITIKI